MPVYVEVWEKYLEESGRLAEAGSWKSSTETVGSIEESGQSAQEFFDSAPRSTIRNIPGGLEKATILAANNKDVIVIPEGQNKATTVSKTMFNVGYLAERVAWKFLTTSLVVAPMTIVISYWAKH